MGEHRLEMMQRKKGQKRPKPTRVDDDDDEYDHVPQGHAGGGGIKWKYIFFIVLLFGTTAIPIVIKVLDALAPMASSGLRRAGMVVGFQAGMVATPRHRLEKFYEKHNPAKLPEVPTVLRKYADDYPKMIKILEAKYHDYGFFIGWQDDDSTVQMATRHLMRYGKFLHYYYRRHVPLKLRITFYRMFTIVYNALRPIIDRVRKLIKSITSR